MGSDWPLILGGVFVSLLLVPLFVYYQLVVESALAGGGSPLPIGVLALVPGFLMGGIGIWTAARG